MRIMVSDTSTRYRATACMLLTPGMSMRLVVTSPQLAGGANLAPEICMQTLHGSVVAHFLAPMSGMYLWKQ